MFHLAVPVAVSAYARTALSTLQHLLVPRGFRRSGASAEYALATYGVIQGMVFPVLFFPSAPLNVLSQLIVPELTESQVAGHRRHINYLVSRVFRLGFFFAVAISGIFFALAEPLGLLLYQSNEASFFLRVFAPIASVIYLDTLTDGMLKGLGQQVSSMRFNIIDALTGVICTWFLLPRFAISGYLFTVFATELLNFVLSFAKLLSITDFSLSLKELLFACISITCALFPAKKLSLASPLASLILQIIITILLYFCLLFLTGCLKREDLQWFRSLFYEPAALRQRPFRHR